ncbi:DUF3885 domain-containing protein [Metabacillus halosaccharovorans]|uniref:DUF3885 domain-containing protein n=1 Tax=Metabacillus halosaccharovorans TaxID=930124 RepID=UPI003FD7B2EB
MLKKVEQYVKRAGNFLNEHFNGLVLAPGLFYTWKNSIRFELSPHKSQAKTLRVILSAM